MGLLHNNETLQQLQTLHVLHVNFATVPGTKPAVLQTSMKRATLMETLKLPSIPEDLEMLISWVTLGHALNAKHVDVFCRHGMNDSIIPQNNRHL